MKSRKDVIIIATGSGPIVPAVWQDFPGRVLTSDSLFEQQSLPCRIAVVGLGAIGIELAQAIGWLGPAVYAVFFCCLSRGRGVKIATRESSNLSIVRSLSIVKL